MAPGGQFGEWVGDVAVSNVEVVDWLLKALIVPLSENKYFIYEGWQSCVKNLVQSCSAILKNLMLLILKCGWVVVSPPQHLKF